ncbi:hypothetical protein BGW39_007551 [Mortierella sp. 14UC]|nr:hypothetical protein BGW39_007551 [Mortierella sp. 14UC]
MLRRETTDESCKMFTTLYDNDNNNSQTTLDTQPLFHTNATSMLNPASSFSPASWTTSANFTPVSPASPTSSCFSSSGNDTETEIESAYSSPATCILPYKTSAANTSIDAAMMDMEDDSIEYNIDSHTDLFTRMKTQDLFPDSADDMIAAIITATSVTPSSVFDYSAAEVALFGQQEYQQHQHHDCKWKEEKPHHANKEALHIFNSNDNDDDNITKSHNCYGSNMGATSTATTTTTTTTGGGPTRRSHSRSPLVSFAPYPSPSSTVVCCASLSRAHHQHQQHNTSNTSNTSNINSDDDAMWQQQDSFDSEPQQAKQQQDDDTDNKIEYDDNDNDDAMSTCSTSSSLSSAPSSRCGSPETCDSVSASTSNTSASSTPVPTLVIPGTEGMTTIRQNDGSIMCYNPITDAVSFICDICLAAAPPTHTSSSRPQSFGRIHDLKRHQATKHPQAASIHGAGEPKVYPCEFCEKPFARRDALLRHYTVKSARNDGVHPTREQQDLVEACRARAKLI